MEKSKLNKLDLLGYNSFYEKSFKELNREDLIPGRIAVENKNNYEVFTEAGEVTAEVSGNLLFNTEVKAELPKVGDWVALALFDDLGIIHNVLKRQVKLSRKNVDNKTEEQVIAANVDVVFVMQSANDNFNLNRMERQVTAIYNSGAMPAIILSKTDLCDDVENLVSEIKVRLSEIQIFPLSSIKNNGLEELEKNMLQGKTYIIIGSSGVGKSTLINSLIGEDVLKTLEIREADSKGRHATTRRQMLVLPNGGIIIDTPGMREFGLWEDVNGISKTYFEFEEYAHNCKYDDCSHTVETGCAVLKAVEDGEIDHGRYENYLKLRKELNYLETKIDVRKAIEEKKKWITIQKDYRRIMNKGKKK